MSTTIHKYPLDGSSYQYLSLRHLLCNVLTSMTACLRVYAANTLLLPSFECYVFTKATGQSGTQVAHAGNSTTCDCIWRSGDTAPRILNVSGYLMACMIFCGLYGSECFLITTNIQQSVNLFQKIQIHKSSNNIIHWNAIKKLNCKIINIPNYVVLDLLKCFDWSQSQMVPGPNEEYWKLRWATSHLKQ
jgi:hypothetical protein